ncbi:MAG: hypothetical protein ACYS8Y_08960 [Planctomycetota bacterium]|jgi:hypothetical protein
MAEHEEIIQSSDFKDRKTALVVFGILQIILGGLCALLVPFMIIGMLASAFLDDTSAPQMQTGAMISGLLFYVLAAAWFISMGIGSIKTRRWARALIFVSSWLWLICGTMGLIVLFLLMPDMYDRMGESGQISPAAAASMKAVMITFMSVIYVIIPGILVLFYGGKNVKATCEFRDPQIRWTDKCPLTVLAASVLFAGWAVSMLFSAGSNWTVPFFGAILTGIAGAAITLISILLLGYIAWGLYKLSIKAWWCAVLLIILWAASAIITFSQVSMLDFYEKMNFPEQQLEFIKQIDILESPALALFIGLWVVALLAFLLYIKKYFPHPYAQQNAL